MFNEVTFAKLGLFALGGFLLGVLFGAALGANGAREKAYEKAFDARHIAENQPQAIPLAPRAWILNNGRILLEAEEGWRVHTIMKLPENSLIKNSVSDQEKEDPSNETTDK